MRRFRVFVILILAGLLLLSGTFSSAQGKAQDPNKDTADEELVTWVLDSFEKAGDWVPSMPRDQGVIFSMKRKGAPKAVLKKAELIKRENKNYVDKKRSQGHILKENPISATATTNVNKFVLGVRVEFMKRGYNWFTLKPPMPIKIPGITKSISVYVVGRGFNHWLWLMVRDFNGDKRYLSAMRPLTHSGWRKIMFPIKPNIVQEGFKVTDPRKVGLTFDGFLVKCDPMEARGKYYIYFDLLIAQVNLYFEFNKDEDDMRDYW